MTIGLAYSWLTFQCLFVFLSFSTIIWLLIFSLRLGKTLARHNPRNNRFNFNLREVTKLPLVSIVIPARNEEMYVKRCIDTILSQSYPHLEVLVIDDDSSDSTAKILREIRDNRFKTITVKDPPTGWARKSWASHVGFMNCSGDLILFTDADSCYLDRNAILNCVMYMQKHSVDVLTGVPLLELKDFCSKMVMPLFNLFSTFLSDLVTSGYVKNHSNLVGSFFITRRPLLDQINGFEPVKESIQEDTDIGEILSQINIEIKSVKIDTMISSMWSRNYKTLKQGITRIVAYDVIKKSKGVIALCMLLFGLVAFPYVLLFVEASTIFQHTSVDSISLKIIGWTAGLCLIPCIGHLVVNFLKHKVSFAYLALTFPASLFLLSLLLSNFISLHFRSSQSNLSWKENKYEIVSTYTDKIIKRVND